MKLKTRPLFNPVLQINLLICMFFGSIGEPPAFQLSTNQNGVLPGSTVHFDWLKDGKMVFPVLEKRNTVLRKGCASSRPKALFLLERAVKTSNETLGKTLNIAQI